jgi:hypothetical protein
MAQESPGKSEPKATGINSDLETVNTDPFFLDVDGSDLHLKPLRS